MTRPEEVEGVYRGAIAGARELWHQARGGGGPDPAQARHIVAGLAAALDAEPGVLIALTETGRDDGDIVVTHMVNVAVLTLAQSALLGIRGPLLEEFGIAALLHDIGKVCTPQEILLKPGPLTPREFGIVKRHVIDGESILRHTPGMPRLAAVVALEHHLKQNGRGYPEGMGRPLNACTSIVSIADVFDALRGDRPYRPGITASRIHALMSDDRRGEFHPALLTHFAMTMRRFRDETAGAIVSAAVTERTR